MVSGEKNLEGSEKNVVGGGASEESVVGGEMSVVTARRTWWAAHSSPRVVKSCLVLRTTKVQPTMQTR